MPMLTSPCKYIYFTTHSRNCHHHSGITISCIPPKLNLISHCSPIASHLSSALLTSFSHCHLNVNRYCPVFFNSITFVHVNPLIQVTFLFILNHLQHTSSSLHLFISEFCNNIYFATSPQNKEGIFFYLDPLLVTHNFQIPAFSHIFSLLSFLVQLPTHFSASNMQ